MKKLLSTLCVTAAALSLSTAAYAHDSTRHDQWSDHTHTKSNMMDAGPRTAGRDGLYKGETYRGNNEEGYYVDSDNEVLHYQHNYIVTDADVYVTRDRYGRKVYYTKKPVRGHADARARTAIDTTPYENLSRDQVRYVQERLNRFGYDIAADGYVGPNTRSALKAYQRDNDLVVTGNINQQTLIDMGIL
jgi:hypothetical protein